MKCDNCGSEKTFIKKYNHKYIIKNKYKKLIFLHKFKKQKENLKVL